MAKKITGYIKLQVPAGAANPSPPIGPALGQRGLNIMEFCKAFNARTAQLEKGMPIPVVITAYQDRSFTFEMKQPPVSYFLKKAAKIDKGSQTPGGRPRRQGHPRPDPRDRREEDGRSQLRHDVESGHGHDRGLRALDGPGSGVREDSTWQTTASASAAPTRASSATKLYPLADAVKLVKERATAKFDETVEVSMNLGVDPRHADQMVRGVCNLPNGSGRTVRVAVFARGAKADEARAAGADIVGAEDLVETRQRRHDRLRPLHRHPGHDAPRRPSRQGSGPARPDAEPEGRHGDAWTSPAPSRPPRAARSSSASRRPASSMPASARPRSTTTSSSRTSRAFIDAVPKAKPAGAKGTYVKRVAISSTMGPGVKVDPSSVLGA